MPRRRCGRPRRWRQAFLAATLLASPAAAEGETLAGEGGAGLEALLAALPGKAEDVMTVTRRFRQDLLEYCRARGCGNLTAVEVGCYQGHTTALLSRLFSRVFVVDNSEPNLAAARARNQDRTNVVYLRVENYSGLQRFEWSALLSGNDIHVAFVDASHRYDHVASDIQSALSLPLVDTLIFDDYGLISPVRKAVDTYIEAGMLRCEPIGEEMEELLRVPAVAEAGRAWAGGALPDDQRGRREGLLCGVLERGARPSWLRALLGMHFSCHRAAAFDAGGAWEPLSQVVEVAFRVTADSLLLAWPPGSGRQPREVRFTALPGHRLALEEEVSPLASELAFGEKLRSGFFIRGGALEHLCLSAEDMHLVAEWTHEDVLRALAWLG